MILVRILRTQLCNLSGHILHCSSDESAHAQSVCGKCIACINVKVMEWVLRDGIML